MITHVISNRLSTTLPKSRFVSQAAPCGRQRPAPFHAVRVAYRRPVCRSGSRDGSSSQEDEGEESSAQGAARGDSELLNMESSGREASRSSRSSGGGDAMLDAMPVSGSDTDWRAFRARLVAQERQVGAASGNSESSSADQAATTSSDAGAASGDQHWAHALPRPERGALLLAHPLMFDKSQQYFHQAAILLLDHDEGGSYGVILNRPSDFTLGQLVLSKPLLGPFDACRLYVGGDVGDNSLQMLHTVASLEGTKEVVKGVYMGGIEAARSAVESGEASADQFRWFAGYAGWGAGQLQSECQRGVWFTAAASPDVLLQSPNTDPSDTIRDPSSGKDYWHKVLQLMGGDYKQLSDSIQAKLAEGSSTTDKKEMQSDEPEAPDVTDV